MIAKQVELFRRKLNSLRNRSYFAETSEGWGDLQNDGLGYENPDILEKVLSSALAVREGGAAFERDGLVFEKKEYEWPLISIIMSVALQNRGQVSLLDFGGSLGSAYFQNHDFLMSVEKLIWAVVEQPAFVEAGTREFATETLQFRDDLQSALSEFDPQVVLVRGSLQYLSKPVGTLNQLSASGADHLIIDRTPFHQGKGDVLTVQTVPPSIYPAKYPAWIFSLDGFMDTLYNQWDLFATFEVVEKDMVTTGGMPFFWRGFYFRKKDEFRSTKFKKP